MGKGVVAMARKGSDLSEWLERLDELEDAVGDGVLELGIDVNQRYAKYQHERQDLDHPGGGRDHYLTDPLYARGSDMLANLAKQAITRQGSGLIGQAREEVDGWVKASEKVTPRWMGDLPGSHSPYVTDDGREVYRKPPARPRLTDEELRAKNRAHPHPSSRRRRRGRR